MSKLVNSVSLLCICLAVPTHDVGRSRRGQAPSAVQSEDNWAMQGKNYSSNHFSSLTQINAENVKNLKVSWSFSTGLLNGHEGSPLVVNGKMYIHTSFPEQHVSLSISTIRRASFGKTSPSKIAAARAVACCDIVNRGLAYWPGDGKTPSLVVKTHSTAMSSR